MSRPSIFDEQIRSQPAAVEAALDVPVPTLDPSRPLVFTGIGTSLHACRVAAAWTAMLSEGRLRPAAVESHDLALLGSLRAEDQVVVVSHRGTKRYPNRVLQLARTAGATTIAVTGGGAPEPEADVVLRTCPDERASTHTVSYVTALAILGLLVAAIPDMEGRRLRDALRAVPEAQRRLLGAPEPDDLAARLVTHSPWLVTGSGLDAITAEEAALKLKEGTYRWAEGMSVEFALHGTPAAYASPLAVIAIRPTHDDGGRTDDLRRLLATIEVPVFLAGDDAADHLWFPHVDLLARPLVAVVAFQRLVALIARLVGASPEATRTDVEPWRSAILAVRL